MVWLLWKPWSLLVITYSNSAEQSFHLRHAASRTCVYIFTTSRIFAFTHTSDEKSTQSAGATHTVAYFYMTPCNVLQSCITDYIQSCISEYLLLPQIKGSFYEK